ncbi:lipoprotein insertase outer membrane protein LolB [uncultured Neptuniibacter sp.]|uniref:lipoprotein insertase outer membrane protein LolB n=1 Tax=uncultured Neptuniibacter sp. TaxID=502143 RepID=UPI00263305A0|nr:lipoprotein insertase outer membrane protein LolB [uncultured Neptuniibacter sp.]
MLRHLLLITFAIYLGGCSLKPTSTVPIEHPPVSWEEHQQRVSTITSWELDGKIGIRTADDAQSASLSWIQQEQDYQIAIRGPWGQGGASIAGRPGSVIVEIADEGIFEGSSPESILDEQLGWHLPISDIYWWIRGLPAPTKAYQHHLENQQLRTLQQSGWAIEYLAYNSLNPSLPRKIRMTRKELKITLIISTWIRR